MTSPLARSNVKVSLPPARLKVVEPGTTVEKFGMVRVLLLLLSVPPVFVAEAEVNVSVRSVITKDPLLRLIEMLLATSPVSFTVRLPPAIKVDKVSANNCLCSSGS